MKRRNMLFVITNTQFVISNFDGVGNRYLLKSTFHYINKFKTLLSADAGSVGCCWQCFGIRTVILIVILQPDTVHFECKLPVRLRGQGYENEIEVGYWFFAITPKMIISWKKNTLSQNFHKYPHTKQLSQKPVLLTKIQLLTHSHHQTRKYPVYP